MPRYFAELDKDTTVIRVIVCESQALCEELFGGVWEETFIENNYAGKGYTFHSDVRAFSPPQPDPLWTLSADKTRWIPPVTGDLV